MGELNLNIQGRRAYFVSVWSKAVIWLLVFSNYVLIFSRSISVLLWSVSGRLMPLHQISYDQLSALRQAIADIFDLFLFANVFCAPGAGFFQGCLLMFGLGWLCGHCPKQQTAVNS